MVPYLLNHKGKGPSYPERYFTEAFKGLPLVREYRVGLYSLDFANLDKKIDIEIDGEQHYDDARIVEHDLRRTTYLEENGWTVIRVRWAHFKRLSPDDRRSLVAEIARKPEPSAPSSHEKYWTNAPLGL